MQCTEFLVGKNRGMVSQMSRGRFPKVISLKHQFSTRKQSTKLRPPALVLRIDQYRILISGVLLGKEMLWRKRAYVWLMISMFDAIVPNSSIINFSLVKTATESVDQLLELGASLGELDNVLD
ncbi:hypothetical protein FOXG_18192 [Fusarium oxysporum f. sp. lycopersici 4287]|uniref:Uncharacterized protein n=7 Tax=Fusarium oxysporum TaxID=5507 RepID=A0A0J9WHH3_FUSO4|nr:hypothetical protein FOXG_18192 [Fusarium oxysporum f. sp. lycopersici 4287]EXK42234.1 hypothetical protein FOMG_05271 [Fusarium oxysporum f. sp. melonis 26406]KNA96781.1 hypothetical protein FOXG_18192 [Fusarium oxysporum f. sp. lycopersici 4287]